MTRLERYARVTAWLDQRYIFDPVTYRRIERAFYRRYILEQR